jgi:molybdopterin molybdotransferase
VSFDMAVAVDWSARSTRSPRRESADAIWIGIDEGQGPRAEYHRARADAVARVAELLGAARGRVILGFDFAFGYPPGLARALTGRAEALAVWAWLAHRIEDAPDNANNRWDVAAEINRAFPGLGPLWGRPAHLDLPDLPTHGSARAGHGLPDRRAVEARVPGAQPAVKLFTTGSVGSQTLLGLPHLAALRRAFPELAVWPLETGFALPRARLVLTEIYPSLWPPAAHAIRDAGQVLATAARLRAAPAAWFEAPATLPDAARVAREEGWILGVGPDGPLAPALRDDCFALPPGVAWTPVAEALATLRARLAPVAGVEEVPLGAALGRVLAAPVQAARAHPPTANAAVDGWGLAHAHLPPGPPHALPIHPGAAAAGRPAPAVPPGAALRILTGAALPEGVDTVVMQEDAAVEAGRLILPAAPRPGANARAAGEDLGRGDLALPQGRVLRPPDLACAAAVGLGALPVRRRLRVGVLSTGDELVAPGTPSERGIYDANGPMLLGVLARWGMSGQDLGHAPDDADALAARLDAAAAGCDAILTSGGASDGDEDHLSRLLRARGRVHHWRIALKPGRPLMLGQWPSEGGTPLFGLPGNPVAAFVCALLFARPALHLMAGAGWPEPAGYALPSGFAKRKKAGRREYLRARIGEDGRVERFASEGSGRVSGLAWADGLVELPDEALEVAPGDPVRFIPYASFGL